MNQTFCLLNSTSVQSVKCRMGRGGRAVARSQENSMVAVTAVVLTQKCEKETGKLGKDRLL